MSPKLVKFQSAKVSSNTDNLLPLLQIAAKSSKGSFGIIVEDGVLKVFLNGYELQKGDYVCLNDENETLFFIPALSLQNDEELIEDETDLDDEENFDDEDEDEDEDKCCLNEDDEDDEDDECCSDTNPKEEVINSIKSAFSSAKIIEAGSNYINFENMSPSMFQNLRDYVKDPDLVPDEIRSHIRMENEYSDDTGTFKVNLVIQG